MRHPIYKYEMLPVQKAATLLANNKCSLDTACNMALQGVGDMTVLSKRMKSASESLLRVKLTALALMISEGHVFIDAASDDWNSAVSQNTIKKMSPAFLKFPFTSGAIELNDMVYHFVTKEDRILLVFMHSKEMDNMIRDGYTEEEVMNKIENDEEMPFFNCIDIEFKEKTVEESIMKRNTYFASKDRLKKVEEEIIFNFLSVMMFITLKRNTEEVREKIAKGKHSKKSNVPKHNIRVVNVRQIAKKGLPPTGKKNQKSDKTWMVRGHWRNQFYASEDINKPKWIEPYWKGDGKEVLSKIYKT